MYSCQTNKKTYTCVIPTSYKEIRKTRRSKPLLINCIQDDLNIADNRHLAAFGILNALFPFIHNALHCNVALSECLYLTKVEINLYICNFSFVSCLSPVHFSYFVMTHIISCQCPLVIPSALIIIMHLNKRHLIDTHSAL